MAIALTTFSQFDLQADSNIGPRWKKWLARFERLMTAQQSTSNLELVTIVVTIYHMFVAAQRKGKPAQPVEKIDILPKFVVPRPADSPTGTKIIAQDLPVNKTILLIWSLQITSR